MRTGFGVHALVSESQTLDRTSADQVLLDDLRCVRRLHVAVPDAFRVDNDSWAVFALVKASGFINAHLRAETGGFGELLQLGVEFAFSIACAGWARRIGGSGIEADKDMMFERGQALILLGAFNRGSGDLGAGRLWLFPE